ncbi:MAG: hypothetical protein ACTTH7_04865 [Treponema sp.]
MDKEDAYFSVFNHIFDKLSKNQPKEVQNKIQYAFSCVAVKSPIYTINFKDAYTQPFLSARAEAANMFSAILNKKKHIPMTMPDFYYRSVGFKELFNAASDSYYYGARVSSLGKIRTVLVGLLPALMTALFVWRGGNMPDIVISFLFNAYVYSVHGAPVTWYERALYQAFGFLITLTLFHKENVTGIYGTLITLIMALAGFSFFNGGGAVAYLGILGGIAIGNILAVILNAGYLSVLRSRTRVVYDDFENTAEADFEVSSYQERKIGTGILWLCIGGLLGIGILIDLIIMLFKPNP